MAEQGRGEQSHHGARGRDDQKGEIDSQSVCPLDHRGDGAPFDGIGEERMAVRLLAGDAEEEVPGFDPAGIVGDTTDHRVDPTAPLGARQHRG